MSMFDVSRVSVEVGGEEISFETGKLARQAGGAVVVRSGDTMVLCTATAGNLRDVDFLPLTVDVEERHYAAGKIPGSFFRREGRAGERATLTARMIDRPLRPLFPKGWHYETQIVCQPLSVEYEHSYDILAMNGASAAVAVSQIPVSDPRRRGADRQAARRFRPQPRGGDRGRAGDGPRRLRVQRGDPDGGVRGERRHRGRGPRCARHRPRGDQEDLRVDRGAAGQGGQGEARGGGAEDRPGARRADPLLARGEARRGDPDPREARPPGGRQGGRGGGARAVRERLRWRGSRTRSSAPRSRARSTSSRRRSSAAGSRSTRSGPTGAPRTRSGRSSARWTSRPACTARRCSPAGRRRSSPTWRWARAAWTCGSTTSAWSSRRPSGTTTTSRRSRSGRPASCAARSAATSATARSPSERWCPRFRAPTTSPT